MKITLIFILLNVCVLCSMLCSDIAEADPKKKSVLQSPPTSGASMRRTRREKVKATPEQPVKPPSSSTTTGKNIASRKSPRLPSSMEKLDGGGDTILSQINKSTVCIDGTDWYAPDTVNQCAICTDDAASVLICEGGHSLCASCFKSKFKELQGICLHCREALFKRSTAGRTRKAGLLALNNTRFECMTHGCGWSGGYDQLDNHRQSCGKTVPCDFGCGEKYSPENMEKHKQECLDRPCQLVGNLKTTYRRFKEITAIAGDIAQATGKQPLPKKQKRKLYRRMIKIFPLIVRALNDPEPSSQPVEAATTASFPCGYQCGFLATSHRELATHYPDCPEKPVDCHYCPLQVSRKMLIGHEESCDQRLIDCVHCDATLPQGSMADHFSTCINYPVNCSFCHNDFARSQLAEHQTSSCPGRTITCDRCLENTIASELQTHKDSCRFMQNIILPASGRNPGAVLVPQPDARGPFYQEDGPEADTSTIYMAIQVESFLQYLKKGAIGTPISPILQSSNMMSCFYVDQPSMVTTKKLLSVYDWGIWLHQPQSTRNPKYLWTYVDLLDTKNRTIANLEQFCHPYGSEGAVKINGTISTALACLTRESSKKVLGHQFPSNLILVRFRHDKNK